MRKLKFDALGDPDMEDTRYQLKENLNVMILLDASGSMAADIKGKTRMTIAKETITKFVQTLPDGAKVGIGRFSSFLYNYIKISNIYA